MTYADYVLAELRCASLRARVAANDIDAIGLALKGGLISPDQAIDLLDECDAIRLLIPTPPEAAGAAA